MSADSIGGRRVAMRTGATLRYLLADHLGSSTHVLDAAGNPVASQKYYPFGRLRAGEVSPYTDKQFTGHQREGELYYMKARFYDPLAGRFLQPDTIVPDYGNPQALNRYSYVYNNPLRYTDPTGHLADSNTWQYCFVLGCGASRSAIPTEHAAYAARHVVPVPVPEAFATPCPPAGCADPGGECWTCLLADFGDAFSEIPGQVASAVCALQVCDVAEAWTAALEELGATLGSWCRERDCRAIALGGSAILIAGIGVVTLQPELVVVGVGLYAVQFQYTWYEYQQGDATASELYSSALAGTPGLLGERRTAHSIDALISGLETAQEVVCPNSC